MSTTNYNLFSPHAESKAALVEFAKTWLDQSSIKDDLIEGACDQVIHRNEIMDLAEQVTGPAFVLRQTEDLSVFLTRLDTKEMVELDGMHPFQEIVEEMLNNRRAPGWGMLIEQWQALIYADPTKVTNIQRVDMTKHIDPSTVQAAKLTTFLFAHTKQDRRIDKAEYAQLKKEVGHLRNNQLGGLNEEAYEKYSDNINVLGAARADRAAMRDRNRADCLARYLMAHVNPNDRLPIDQYQALHRELGHYRDRKMGGLTKDAYKAFEEYPHVVELAKKDRALRTAMAQSAIPTGKQPRAK